MMNEAATKIYAVSAVLEFPEGFYTGKGGKQGNFLELARDGQGNPVLRGSSLAGVLRHAMSGVLSSADVKTYFGCPQGECAVQGCPVSRKERQESRVVFEDAPFLDITSSEETTHNLISRHTGAVSEKNKGLFSLERVPAGSTCRLFFYVKGDPGREEDDRSFVNGLLSTLNGTTLGGSANRGCGRCVIKDGKFGLKVFDLKQVTDAADFLDLLYKEEHSIPETECLQDTAKDTFALKISLAIPRGQDILCSQGNDMYPVTTVKQDGKEYWKIPGSSFRGVFRAWMTRLAARDGEKILQSVERYQGPCAEEQVVKLCALPEAFCDSIMDLFGSLPLKEKPGKGHKGRIHFADAFSVKPISSKGSDTQKRSHVVIDRFTGGTNVGKLFENHVLTSAAKLEFSLTLSIVKPRQKELDWLSRTLKALDLGLIRIGSSKSAGRLEVKEAVVMGLPNEGELAWKFEK